MIFRRISSIVIMGCLLSLSIPFMANMQLAPAYGAENWKDQLSAICSRTNEAMDLTTDELKSLVTGCDKLKPVIESLEESPRKIYRKRLQMCRDLYAYVLEVKEQRKK